MATFTDGGSFVTRPAGADLSLKQYYIVKEQTDRTLVLASAATDKLFGVVQLGAATGGNVSVCSRNSGATFKVIAGGTIAVNDMLTSDSAGKAVATTTTGDEVIGVAQEAASANGILEYMPLSKKYS